MWVASGLPVAQRTPQEARAALTRGMLLAVPLSVVAFIPLDFFSGAEQTWGLVSARVLFIIPFGLTAWRFGQLTPGQRRLAFMLLSASSSLALGLMCLGTGGIHSPAFTFLWAVPLILGLLFVNEPACPLIGGVLSVPFGYWLLSQAGKPFVELVYWLMVSLVATGISVAASIVSRRMQALELEHEKTSEKRLANILDSMPLAVRLSNATQLVYANQRSRELLPRWTTPALPLVEPLGGQPYSAAAEPLARALTGVSTTLEAELQLDDRRLPVEVHSEPVKDSAGKVEYVVSVFRDITERRQLQARLAHSDRLTSLGTLSAGVAHEINNPLASVVANLELSQSQLQSTNLDLATIREVRAQLSDATAAAARIGTIVADLGAFSHAEASNNQVADLQRVVEAALQMAKGSLASKNVSVHLDLGGAAPVTGNEGKLAQVFWNLLTNAAHAMPANRQGNEVRIFALSVDGMIRVDVTDNGEGIGPRLLSRVFEPFFTTRDLGQGTGLGLSTSHGIVKAAGGSITVESELGKGSTFRVTLLPTKPR